MSETNRAHAPYNFVPFHAKSNSADGQKTERVCIRYENAKQLPEHNRIYPELKTGEIHVKMTAETPVFVSSGEDGHFYCGANGQLMIPGSTVRGMLRQNMQILGYGTVRPDEDIEDQRIFFRSIAASNESLYDPLSGEYRKDVKAIKKGEHIPPKVFPGYLCRENDRIYIYPPCSSVICVSRDDPVLRQARLNEGYSKLEHVSYALQGIKLRSISAAAEGNGVLLYPGEFGNDRSNDRNEQRKKKPPNTVYLFPAADWDATPLELTDEDKLAYEEDLKIRESVLGEAGYDFRSLPKEDRANAKPVFYVQPRDGHTYFGMTSHPRIGYAHSLADGLPDQDSRTADGVDYPHALLGYAGRERSYRSRVSVGDFPAEDGAKEGEPVSLILGQPKPSWFPGYVVDGKHYNTDDFSLRGFKLYWQKEAKLPPDTEGKDSVKTKMRPLPAGTVFHGVIRYKNLHPDELGLLLWALRLEDGCRQSLGMAKPYGYGRMRLDIGKLLEYDIQKLYAPDGLCAGPVQAPDSVIEEYIRQFDAFICERLHIKKPSAQKPSITSQNDIQDFFFMHKPFQGMENIDYLDLNAKEYKNLTVPLPTVQDIRKRQETKAAQDAPAGEMSMDDMLVALQKNKRQL